MEYHVKKDGVVIARLSCEPQDSALNTPAGCELVPIEAVESLEETLIASSEPSALRPTGRMIDPQEMNEMRRTNALARIEQLEAKERRYVAENSLNRIDEEGRRRWTAIRDEIDQIRQSGVLGG